MTEFPRIWKLPAISKLPVIWDRVMRTPASTPLAGRRFGIVITAIDDFESLEFPWCSDPDAGRSARAASRCHARGQSAGALLHPGFRHLGELRTARKRRDRVRRRGIGIQPQDDSASGRRYRQEDPGFGRRCRAQRTNTGRAGRHPGRFRGAKPSRPVVGCDGSRRTASGRAAGTGQHRSPSRAGAGQHAECNGRRCGVGAANHLSGTAAGSSSRSLRSFENAGSRSRRRSKVSRPRRAPSHSGSTSSARNSIWSRPSSTRGSSGGHAF